MYASSLERPAGSINSWSLKFLVAHGCCCHQIPNFCKTLFCGHTSLPTGTCFYTRTGSCSCINLTLMLCYRRCHISMIFVSKSLLLFTWRNLAAWLLRCLYMSCLASLMPSSADHAWVIGCCLDTAAYRGNQECQDKDCRHCASFVMCSSLDKALSGKV